MHSSSVSPSTYDGLAIACAVAEHYHELTELAKRGPGIANYSVAAREHGDDVVFLHRLTHGPASRSYGVAVARLAGIPEGVLARAKAMLTSLESGSALGGGRPGGRGPSPGTAQLDLFAPADAEGARESAEVLGTLRAVDVDRLTPLDALQLIAKLKGILNKPGP